MAQESSLKPIAQESDEDMAFTPNQYTQAIWDYLMSFIGNEYGVAGLMGNLYYESHCYPNMLYGDTDPPTSLSIDYTNNVDDGTMSRSQFISSRAYGLAQWLSSNRKANLYDGVWVTGGDPPTPSNSIGSLSRGLNMIKWELTEGGYSSTLTYLRQATNTDAATQKVFVFYEGAGDDTLGDRQTFASEIYNEYAGGSSSLFIEVSRIGNGSITVSDYTPNAGDTITLRCIPSSGETLLDIEARTVPSGSSMALSVVEEQTFPMPNESLTILATFTGITPPTPPPMFPRKIHRMPIWMYPMFKRN